jgi:hypothetical protein
MANCEDIRPLLGAYADAQLDALENDAVLVHLQQCGRCRQIVRDQQQVQHVLDSWQPPAVPSDAWADMGRRLRAELENKASPTVLKTRPRTDALEPTPESTPALRLVELEEPVRRAAVRPELRKAAAAAPLVTVVRIRPKRSSQRFMWVAHLVGAAAACLVLFFGLAASWTKTPQQAGPAQVVAPLKFTGTIALARPSDVTIMDIQTLDPNYNVVVDAGDTADTASVWVVPSREEG